MVGMKFAIRDDDVSYDTDRAMLEELYSHAFSRGIRISFAVIPFTLKENQVFPISKNWKLCSFLAYLCKKGSAEILLHGLYHDKEEFDTTQAKAESMIGSGLKELIDAFPGQKVSIFVPPKNKISEEGLKGAFARGLDVSTSHHRFYFDNPINYIKNFPELLKKKGTYPPVRGFGDRKVIFSDEEIFGNKPGKRKEPQKELAYAKKRLEMFKKRNGFVLSNHHLDFFADRKDERIKAFDSFIGHACENGWRSVLLSEIR